MGYFVKGKEIAKLNPKARVVSLSASPNFVQFESKDVNSRPFEVNLFIDQEEILSSEQANFLLNFHPKGGLAGFVITNNAMKFENEFHIRLEQGTMIKDKYPDDIAIHLEDNSFILKSLMNSLLKNEFMDENYEITQSGKYINLKAKQVGEEYTFNISSQFFYDLLSLDDDPIKVMVSTNKIVHTVLDTVALPVSMSIKVADYRGYQFEDVASLPSGVEPVDLEKGVGLDNLKKHIEKTDKRTNPYTSYFKDSKSGYYRFVNYTRFAIVEKNKSIEHWFQGIDPIMKLSGVYETSDYSYELTDDAVQTAQNLREALLQCPYLRDNFRVQLKSRKDADLIENLPIIRIESMGVGSSYNFDVKINKTTEDKDYEDYKLKFDRFAEIKKSEYDSLNPDTINEGAEPCEIQLDMYADTGLFLGEDDKPDMDDLGVYMTTLSKAYRNEPVWFDLNAIQTKKYKAPFGTIDADCNLQKSDSGVWFDAGTYANRRFVAKRVTATTSQSFYYSPVLYTLTGFERNLQQSDLTKYVYDVSATTGDLIQPLSLQPALSHVRGQIQYFNFVLKDKDHHNSNLLLGLQYELLTQSGILLDTVTDHQQISSRFGVVNTVALDIDRYVDQYPNLGIVRVSLAKDGNSVSLPLIFNILPSYLYQVHDFVFLNSLGGWSSFNFGDQNQLDFKTSSSTLFRNQTPSANLSSSIETVYTKAAEERFIVRTHPITLATADWLKEMSASIAVFERKSRRYIIVDEMNVKYTSQDNFVRLEMKYHYSDSFNSQH